MGIIRKQSVVSSIVIYIGFLIGAFNIVFLFPKYLTADQFGLTRILIDVALMLAMFCTLGATPAAIKFYPFYKSYLPKEKNDLPFLAMTVCIIGAVLLLIIAPQFKGLIIKKFGARSPLFVEYFDLLYPLTICYAFFSIFEAYSWSLRKTILPNFLKEVLFRLLTSAFLFLLIAGLFHFNTFIHLFSWIYLPFAVIMLFALTKSGEFPLNISISSVTKRMWKRISVFSLFIFSGQLVNIIARTSDSIVITSQAERGLTDLAVFTIASYLISLMDVPLRGISGISISVMVQAWKDKDIEKINEIYHKSSLNLLIAGMGIGGLLLLNAHNAVKYFGPTYSLLTTMIAILACAKLIDLGTGLNSTLLLASKYWKIDFISNIFFMVFSISLNVFLVKKIGVIGSCYANLVSLLLFNIIRCTIIYRIFKLQPFTVKTLHGLLIGIVCIALSYFLIPVIDNFIVDTISRSCIFVILYAGGVLFFRISPDINDLMGMLLRRLGLRK